MLKTYIDFRIFIDSAHLLAMLAVYCVSVLQHGETILLSYIYMFRIAKSSLEDRLENRYFYFGLCLKLMPLQVST